MPSSSPVNQLKLKQIKRKLLKRKKIKRVRKKVRFRSALKMSSSNELKPDNYQVNAKICRLVEKYPCMYDRSNPHYLKKDVVDKSWIKISKEMDDSIPSCKERWRNIRTSFARSINVNKIPSSANRTKPYYLHEELQFLAKHITPGIPVSRRSNAYLSAGEESETIEVSVGEDSFDGFAAMLHDEEEESQGHTSSIEEMNERNELKSEQNKQEELQLDGQIIHPQINNQQLLQTQQMLHKHEVKPDIPICPPKKRHRELIEANVPEIEYDRDTKPKDISFDTDFDALFLQSILPDVRAMDFRQKLIFKRRIYEVVSDIFENSPHTTTLPHNTSSIHIQPSSSPYPTQSVVSTSTITNPSTMVNAADLMMIRRLNALLKAPCVAATSPPTSTLTVIPKNVTSISSTVRSIQPAPATVALHRGALTRAANANQNKQLHVTMLNSLSTPASSTSSFQSQIKQEPELLDDD